MEEEPIKHITHYNKKKDIMECKCGAEWDMREGLRCPIVEMEEILDETRSSDKKA